MSRTKIVATIGPASSAPETLEAMIRAGMDVARINLSHGDLAEHLDVIARVRAAADATGRVVAVLADLPGPKPRTRDLGAAGIELGDEERWTLTDADVAATPGVLPVDDPAFLAAVATGDHVALGDGAVVLVVDEVASTGAVATVRVGGHLRGRPGIRVIGAPRVGVVPTARDAELLAAMLAAEVDLVGVSFVVGADDLHRVRALLPPADDARPTPLLVAKIETAEAVDALDDVLAATDAVMVARGDLGMNCPLEDVPLLQKQIIDAAVRAAKPVITATQMLESMTTAEEPTRAEVSDVANAVLDGTDAVMLSGETAIGVDPVRVIRTMRRIASRADDAATAPEQPRPVVHTRADAALEDRITDAIGPAACRVAADVGARAILCWTRAGSTARAVARSRPRTPVIGLSTVGTTLRGLALSWGVEPLRTPEPVTDVDGAIRAACDAGAVRAGDVVVVVAGVPDTLRVVAVP